MFAEDKSNPERVSPYPAWPKIGFQDWLNARETECTSSGCDMRIQATCLACGDGFCRTCANPGDHECAAEYQIETDAEEMRDMAREDF